MATIPLKAKHLPALRQRTFFSFAVKVMACLFLPLFVLSRSLFAGNTGNNPGNENGSSPEVREILCNATINYPGSPFCNGISAPQAVILTGTSGGAYTSAPSGLIINTFTGELTPSSSSSGTYTITYAISGVGGCAATTQVTILPAPIATSASTGYTICSGTSPNIILSSNQAGTTFSWTCTNGTSGNGSPITNVLTNSICPNAVLNYTVTPTNTCVGNSILIPVSVIPTPVSTFSVSPSPACSNQTSTITFSGAACAGSTFNWTWPVGPTITGSGAGPYQAQWLIPFTYPISLKIISPTGACTSAVTTVTTIVNQPPSAGINGTYPFCPASGPHNLFSSLGGTPLAGGVWTGPSLLTGGSNGTFTPGTNTPGIYTYTIPAAGGCPAVSRTVNVTLKPAPAAVITAPFTELNCAHPTLSLAGSGGTGYSWSNGLGSAAAATASAIGNYVLTVTAANGCTGTANVNITQNFSIPTAGITAPGSQINCVISSILLTASGGATYSWNNGLGTNSIVPATAGGTYTVTAIGANGCTDTESIIITEDITSLTADITSMSTVLTCSNTSIVLTATGGNTYSWNNGLGTNPVVTVTSPGTYVVTATSTTGCIDSDVILITQNIIPPLAGITSAPGTQLNCAVSAIVLSGTGGVSYSWSGGLGTNPTATAVSAGPYTVTATGANGCTDTHPIVITANYTLPVATLTWPTTLITCAAPVITLTAGGGATYSWSNGLGTAATAQVNTSGTYTATVIGANGCSASQSVTITSNFVAPFGEITAPTSELNCFVDSIVLTANGGGTYLWGGGLGTLPEITVTLPAIYSVIITAPNGCKDTVTIEVTKDNTIAFTSLNATICQGDSLVLPNGSSVSTAGAYPVVLTGANGCDSTVTTILVIRPNIIRNVNAQICSGESYVLPGGTAVSANGSYPVMLQSVFGCDSLVITHLQVKPILTTDIVTQICTGETYTLADGSTVSAQGVYVTTIPASTNCDSVITTALSIISEYTSSTDTVICFGTSYTLPNGTVVSTQGSFPVTLQSISGCDSVVTTNLSIAPPVISTVNASFCTGANYTLPDGSTVSSAGTYPVALTAASGCDSIVTFNLTIIGLLSSTVDGVICLGQPYILPDGSSATTAGPHVVIISSVAGCDSVVTTNLTGITPLFYFRSALICNGAVYTFPDGTTATSSGLYQITLQAISGCDSVLTVNLGVRPPFSSTIDIRICFGDSYTLPDGAVESSSGAYQSILPSVTGCDSIITTNLIVDTLRTGIVNAQICSGNTYLLLNGTVVSSEGVYIATIQSLAGCDSVVTTNLSVLAPLSSSVTAQMCENESYTLLNGVTVNSAGIYPVTLLSGFGCDSVVTTTLVVDSVLTSTVDTAVCLGQTYILPDGSVATASGTYVVTIAPSTGCDSVVTTNLTVNSILTSSIDAAICSGQTYLLPDGSSVSATGIYPITIISAGGCDSVITANLTVLNSLAISIDAAICSGQNYLLPDGSSVSAAGTYPITMISAGGCDSVITTNLTVNSILTSSIDTAICTGQTYLLPDGSSVSTAGTYPVTFVSVGGCDSVITTNLTVNSILTSSIDAAICSGQTYLLPDGSSVSTAGTYPVTLVSAGGCDSVITTNLTVNSILTSSIDTTICSGDLYLFPNGDTASASGSFPITVLTINGCDSVVTVNLNVLPPINSIINAEICTGQNYILPDGTSVSQSGSYPITIPVDNGCDSLITTNLTVRPLVIPVVSPSAEITICSGQQIVLNATGANEFLWSPAAGISDTNAAVVAANPTITTTYIITGITGQCSGETTIEITVSPTPAITISSLITQICEGDSMTLSATGADSYAWISGDSLGCTNCQNPVIYPLQTGLFTVAGTTGTCSDTVSVQIVVSQKPTITIAGDTLICQNKPAVITATGGNNLRWNTGESTPIIHAFPQENTVYTVIATNGACTDTASISVNVNPAPIVNAGADTTIRLGSSVDLLASGTISYQWTSNQLTLSCIDCADPVASPSDTTEYCVIGTDALGCEAADCIVINVELICGDLFIPDAFSPVEGGDKENDCFKVYGVDCIKTMKLTVFNRWGERIIIITDPRDCWDGTFNGKPLNSEVFIYYFEAAMVDNSEIRKEGNITLLR